MYSDDFFKSIERQRQQIDKLIKPTTDLYEKYGIYGMNTIKAADYLPNMQNTINTFTANTPDIAKQNEQTFKAMEINKNIYIPDLKSSLILKNAATSFNIPKLSNIIYESSFSFPKSMNTIYQNNTILADSISRTIELAKINSPVFNNQFFRDLQNTFSISGLDFSKTVLTEITNILKNYNDNIEKNYDITENSVENKVDQSKNDEEFDDVFNEIDNQSTPFTENKLKKIIFKLFNVYRFILEKTNKYSELSTESTTFDLIFKSFNENPIKSDQKEILFLVISVIVWIASSKFNNKQK